MAPAIVGYAKQFGVEVPAELEKTETMTPEVIDLLREVCWRFFPLLAPDAKQR